MHGGGGSWINLPEINLTGTAIVDSAYYYPHYYLDVDGDYIPDYRLNFGPHWYDPGNGATRPLPGDEITIVGGLVDYEDIEFMDIVIVWEINGQFWQEPNAYGWGGCHVDHHGDTVYCPTDPLNQAEFPNGCMGGCGWNQMYVEFLEQDLWEIPAPQGTMFGGYHFIMLRTHGMGSGNDLIGDDGYVQFNGPIPLNLHYTDDQLEEYGLIETDLTMHRWNANNESWIEVTNAQVNTVTNTVTVSSSTVYSYYALAGTFDVLGNDPDNETAEIAFPRLYQNYPNPFNPITQISYSLNRDGQVNLSVYDISGRLVRTLVDGPKLTGLYTTLWDGLANNGLHSASGTYFYVLSVDGHKKSTRLMVLLK
ncbi:MAG: T9SS type A sorting domain-containing protein [Planctomycetes bacterium]|nr:T9SS type A sorting domain-containing protein [Planctomycetota bacterium]